MFQPLTKQLSNVDFCDALLLLVEKYVEVRNFRCAVVWLYTKRKTNGLDLIGILHWEKMQSCSVVAWFQLSHWNKGLPLIGLVDFVHLGSLKYVLAFSLYRYVIVLLLSSAQRMQQPIPRRKILTFLTN